MVVSSVKRIVLIFFGMLIIGVLSWSYKSNRPTKDEMIGKCVMTNYFQDSYKFHDSIEFQNNKAFISTIVPNTINFGKWNYSQGKINYICLF